MDMKSDVDPQETREWQEAIEGVIDHEGPERAHFLIEQVIDKSRRRGAYVPFSANTAYINTIPVDRQLHSTTSATTTSGMPRRPSTAATWSSCRDIPLPESTRARSCWDASPRSRWTTSARRSTARASR